MDFRTTRHLILGLVVTAGTLAATGASATDFAFNVVTANTTNSTQFSGANTNGSGSYGTGAFNAVAGALSPATSNFASSTFTFRTPGTGIDLSFAVTAAPDLNSSFFSSAPTGSIVAGSYVNTSTVAGGSGTVTYGGSTVADFSTLSTFLNSNASTSGFGYGSLYTIDLGFLATGTILTIDHDDGISIAQGGARVFSSSKAGGSEANPTSRTTDTFTIATSGNTTLYYARENSSPSVLTVKATRVPEPASMAILALGLFGAAAARRRK